MFDLFTLFATFVFNISLIYIMRGIKDCILLESMSSNQAILLKLFIKRR